MLNKLKKTKNTYVFAPMLVIMMGMGMIAAVSDKSKSNDELTNSQKSTGTKSKEEKNCVFRTLFGEEESDSNFIYKTPAKVVGSLDDGLQWISKAQQKNGGWGAGTHARQDVYSPMTVKTDPASTAMVAMALLRNGNTPTWGTYSENLRLATEYLLDAVEQSTGNPSNITNETGTQPQVKLGQNIDVVLTSQYFTNLIDHIKNNPLLKSRIKKALDICVTKIQNGQNANGSQKGAGWAGVLQSAFATNALETAKDKGVNVDEKKLEQSRNYQKGNYDTKGKTAKTEDAAGVMLYSISGTARASSKEARIAKEKVATAKREGRIAKDADITVESLQDAGMSEADALKYSTAYEINQAAKQQAQRDDIMTGYGNNGGEEFLSFLQTGEGMIMAKDIEWKKWYDNVSGKLVRIQNNDGSWNGHHCITSPVFCTATCLLILSVNNDVEQLMAMGGKQ